MYSNGDLIGEKYEIVSLIGQGGMSAVYRALDRRTGQVLAIKEAQRNGKSDQNTVEMSLVSEGRLLKNLSNERLPKIYDIVEKEDSFLLVMDFIEGESLDKVIALEGPQPLERVYDIGIQLCRVFDYLHNQQPPIIYRDMKPANIIYQPDGQIKMIDFGTARTFKGNNGTQDTICIGTAGFAAPEQYGGLGESDARTDIFCLGATLYNLVTGHSPYDVPKGILPLVSWNPALKNSPLDEIIRKCTRNDPSERYQTVQELMAALTAAMNESFRPSFTSTLKNIFKPQVTGDGKGFGSGYTITLPGMLPNVRQEPQEPESVPVPAPEAAPESGFQEVQPEPSIEQRSPWKKLFLVCAAVTVLLLLLSLVLLVTGMELAAYIVLIFAAGSGVLLVISLLKLRHPAQWEE